MTVRLVACPECASGCHCAHSRGYPWQVYLRIIGVAPKLPNGSPLRSKQSNLKVLSQELRHRRMPTFEVDKLAEGKIAAHLDLLNMLRRNL